MKVCLNLILIGVLSLSIISCNDDDFVITGEGLDSDQYLIEMNHVNGAWGNWFSSHFILSNGEHYYFQERTTENGPVPADWREADENGFISIEDLSKNFIKADSLVQIIDSILLAELPDLVESMQEDLTEPQGKCADAGIFSIYVYAWDSNKDKFSQKLVRQCGDIARKNNHLKAQNILDLLSELPIPFVSGCCID